MINNKPLITLLGIVAAINVIFAGVYFFVWNHINKTSVALEEMALEVEVEMNKDGAQHDLISFVAESADAREDLSRYFVTKDNFVAFLEGIEQLTADAHVTLTDSGLNISDGILALNYSIEGPFENIMYFTGLVELLPYNLSILSLNTEKKPGREEAQPIWETRLRVEVKSFIE